MGGQTKKKSVEMSGRRCSSWWKTIGPWQVSESRAHPTDETHRTLHEPRLTLTCVLSSATPLQMCRQPTCTHTQFPQEAAFTIA